MLSRKGGLQTTAPHALDSARIHVPKLEIPPITLKLLMCSINIMLYIFAAMRTLARTPPQFFYGFAGAIPFLRVVNAFGFTRLSAQRTQGKRQMRPTVFLIW